jgi:hypothetical protein
MSHLKYSAFGDIVTCNCIGSFSGAKWPKRPKGGEWREECSMKLWFCGLVVATLLVTGGVEINPGPFSFEEEVQICKFIMETKSKDLEVRGFMERIEKSLSGLNTVIMVLSEKMDEGNKAVKGLKERWNKMLLELDELKKRHNNWEWKSES